MNPKGIITGIITTIIIGGSAYTVSQTDVINNFADDTGMTQQQAEEYVKNIGEEDLISYDELGREMLDDSKEVAGAANEIDCVKYEYEWETSTLSCDEGKLQLKELGNSEAALGNAYVKLSSDSASKEDISTTIKYIDNLNNKMSLEIVGRILDASTIKETKQTNSYNKATLEAALEGN